MDEYESVLDGFLKRMGAVLNAIQGLILVWFVFYVMYRIPANIVRRRKSETDLEYQYFSFRLGACVLFSYANFIFIMGLITDWFPTYWPAFSEVWMDAGARIGQPGHTNALLSDMFWSWVISGAYYWRSTAFGETTIALDGEEVWHQPHWMTLKKRCDPVIAELARLRSIQPLDQAKIHELEEELALHKSTWG